jgi:hypothetical protein
MDRTVIRVDYSFLFLEEDHPENNAERETNPSKL